MRHRATARPRDLRVCVAALLLACVGAPTLGGSINDSGVPTSCNEPRPEICTQEYLPVCGLLTSGRTKTYSNACTACSDPEVLEHRPEACEFE